MSIRRAGPVLILVLLLVGCGEGEGLPTVAPSAEAQAPTATAMASREAGATLAPTATQTATAGATPAHTPTVTMTATREPTETPTSTATASATPTAQPTNTPNAALAAYPPLPLTPGDPQPYLERFTLVSFYGSAEGAGMGILNFRETPQLLVELGERAAEYQRLLDESDQPRKQVLPTFHVIVTIADPWFGEDGNFNHRASPEAIESWLALAEQEGIAVVLDVQPGHAPVQEEFELLRPYLRHPHVHLAIDSEYTMERTPSGLYEIPGEVLGSLYAAQINPIQAQLEEIALETGANKVLILHQFEDEMLPDKENIVDYPHVELVIDSDGFGGPDKVRDYQHYASEPGFEYGGFKLYRNWDNPLLSPAEVMGLAPPPAVVIYQ